MQKNIIESYRKLGRILSNLQKLNNKGNFFFSYNAV